MGFLLCALPGRAAWADDNDIVLSRLGQMVNGAVVGNGADFRSLMSELGVVHAPRLLSPADTLGFGGFQFTTDLGLTSVDSGAGYWRARAGSCSRRGRGRTAAA